MGKWKDSNDTNYSKMHREPRPSTSLEHNADVRKVGHGDSGETVDGDDGFGSEIPGKPRSGSGFDTFNCDF